jgi:hypothetical protein
LLCALYAFEMGLLHFYGPKSSVTRHLGIKPSGTPHVSTK